MAGIARPAHAILDGTLIRTERLGGTANRRFSARASPATTPSTSR
jgi:hypothetical protein